MRAIWGVLAGVCGGIEFGVSEFEGLRLSRNLKGSGLAKPRAADFDVGFREAWVGT